MTAYSKNSHFKESSSIPTLRRLTSEDVKAALRIHIEAFPAYRSTRLGSSYLGAVYQWFAEDPNAFGIVAELDGEIVGFVTGSAENYGSSQIKALWLQFVRAILRRPWLLFDRSMCTALRFRLRNFLLGERARNPVGNKPYVPTAVLLSIGVASQFKGKGTAGVLISAFEEEAVRRGFARVRLSVFKDNRGACRAYEKAGWHREEDSMFSDAFIYVKKISAYPNAGEV